MSFSVFNCVSSNAMGGLEQMFIDYADVLNEGYRVLCIVSENFKYFDELDSRGIPYEIIKVRNYYDLIATYQFIKLYRKHHPQFIFSHNGRFNSVIKISSRLTDIGNTFGVCHGDVKRLEHFSKIITVSMALKKQLLNKQLKDVFFLPNFINPTKVKEYSRNNKSKTYTFGLMSRLAPEKSIDIGLNALKELVSLSDINYQMIIAGTGPELQNLVNLTKQNNIEDRVTFLDWVDNKDSFYSQIDCFLIPSQHEPFGITILEAFNYGLPVIAAKAEGPLEIIEHEVNGFLFDINNVEKLTHLMNKISLDPSLSKQIGDEGYKTLIRKYTRQVFKKNLYALLDQKQAKNL